MNPAIRKSKLTIWWQSKAPSRTDIEPILAIVVFMVFSWTLYRMFWQVPSWSFYLNVWDILIIAAYVLSQALFESFIILGFIIGLCIIFPKRIFCDKFIVQGSLLAMVICLSAFAIQRKIGLIYGLNLYELIIYPIAFLVAVVFWIFIISLFNRWLPWLADLIKSIADRMTIFLYLYIPLGVVGIVVVALRNLF